MKIVDIRERTISIGSPMRNAVIDFSGMTLSLVAVITDQWFFGQQLVGYGFSSPGRYGQAGILRDRLIPRLLEADEASLCDDEGIISPPKAWQTMLTGEKPGGHGDIAVATSVLDLAFWDLAAKSRGLPLHQHLADQHNGGTPDQLVWTYAAGGYYREGDSTQDLVREMRGYIDAGYEAVKLKIGGLTPTEDVARYHEVCDAVGGERFVAVDANARLSYIEARYYADAFSERPPRWYEEPGDPLDFLLLAELAEHYPGPLATGENLFGAAEARNLLRYGDLRPDHDILQFDPGLTYGISGYVQITEILAEHGWSRRQLVPHGGHHGNLCVAAALGLGGTEAYPGVFAPLGGFADPVEITPQGAAPLDAPGLGIEHKAQLWAELEPLAG